MKGGEVSGAEEVLREVGASRWEVVGSPTRPELSWSLVSVEVTVEAESVGRRVSAGAGKREDLVGSGLLPRGSLRGRSWSEP